MDFLVQAAIVVAIIWLVVFLIRYKGWHEQPTSATVDQIPSIVSKLKTGGTDGSFVVFMFPLPGNSDDTYPNLQYSIEDGQLGLDWVLVAPQNIKDATEITNFVERRGHAIAKREMNGVEYLRVDDYNLDNLGIMILRDFYHLSSDAKLDLVVSDFDIA